MPFEEFGAWQQGFNQLGPRPPAGFGERMPFLCEERRWASPRPKPKHKLQLLEIEPSGRSEVSVHRSLSLDCSYRRALSSLYYFRSSFSRLGIKTVTWLRNPFCIYALSFQSFACYLFRF
jgi:hypothetical protein